MQMHSVIHNMDSLMYTYNLFDHHLNERQIISTAGKRRGLLHSVQAKGDHLDRPLRLDGYRDDLTGEAGPSYRSPRVSKLLKEGHQAQVH
jgi:hypothetical protein